MNRRNTEKDATIEAMAAMEQKEIGELTAKLKNAKASLRSVQNRCDHDMVGQDDEHPHGTPRETFICSICKFEEVR